MSLSTHYSDWRQRVAGHPNPKGYHRPPYLDTVASSGLTNVKTLNKPFKVDTLLAKVGEYCRSAGEIEEAKTLRSKLSKERRKKSFRESEDGQLGLL